MDNSLDSFKEWGRVLDTLEKIKKKGDLHNYQTDLVRMLKHRGNWRLCEAALEAIPQIKQPTTPLVSEILNLIMDDNIYYEARVMACHTLNQLVHHAKNSSNGGRTLTRLPITKQLKTLAAVPQPPMLLNAVSKCLTSMTESIKK